MEDVISVDGKTADDVGTVIPQVQIKDDNICSVVDDAVDGGAITLLKKHTSINPDSYFLVLEVQLAFIILGGSYVVFYVKVTHSPELYFRYLRNVARLAHLRFTVLIRFVMY